MQLRFLERRISERPRIYRAEAKSSIGFWARQVCAGGTIEHRINRLTKSSDI
jgi:hypothetical protein